MQLEAAGDKWICVIALFKLVKAAWLIIVGIGVLKLLHRDRRLFEHPRSKEMTAELNFGQACPFFTRQIVANSGTQPHTQHSDRSVGGFRLSKTWPSLYVC
jgi:hypothetical protein